MLDTQIRKQATDNSIRAALPSSLPETRAGLSFGNWGPSIVSLIEFDPQSVHRKRLHDKRALPHTADKC